MNRSQIRRFLKLSKLFSKPHPWHGIDIGKENPDVVKVFIEIVPGDTLKYELDKESGYLKVDRPQRFSNICPMPYGFVPQTFCDTLVGEYCMAKTGRKNIDGDRDPLDICVLTERNMPHGNLILDAIPVGGFRMIDGKEADDKVIAVMKGDAAFGEMKEIQDVPKHIIERLSHYFLTYKQRPFSDENREVEITHIYSQKEAKEVIRRSIKDYNRHFKKDKMELFELIDSGLE